MIQRIAIAFLFAIGAAAQTATNRCAIDLANMRESEADYIDAGLYNTTLGGWFTFIVSPTNATTYASGDASRLRTTLEQTNAAARPSWSTNGMTFDGVNDYLYSTGAGTGMWFGVSFWMLRTNIIAFTSTAETVYSRLSASAGGDTLVRFGPATGSFSNETVTVSANNNVDAFRVAITNTIPSGWSHVAVTWEATNYSIYLNGARPPHIYAIGTSAAVTGRLPYWVGAYLSATSTFVSATIDDFDLLTNSWTAAQIGTIYTNGLRRLGL